MVKNETGNALRFPGQYYDAESGLNYNYKRYYDTDTGRYIREDPIGLNGGNNYYLYAGANPITFYDPDGEAIVSGTVAATMAVGAAIGGSSGAAGAAAAGGGAGEVAASAVAGAAVGAVPVPGTGAFGGAIFGSAKGFVGNMGGQSIAQAMDECKSLGDYNYASAFGTALGGAYGGAVSSASVSAASGLGTMAAAQGGRGVASSGTPMAGGVIGGQIGNSSGSKCKCP